MIDSNVKNIVLKAVNIICNEFLKIDIPKIIFTRCPMMPTPTTKAIANVKNNEIYIDPAIEANPLIVLYIGHELRHIYQSKHPDLKEQFDNYTNSSETTISEYNMQPLEIDAHAFGEICMNELTGCSPLWENFNEEIKNLIKTRKQEILIEEFGIE